MAVARQNGPEMDRVIKDVVAPPTFPLTKDELFDAKGWTHDFVPFQCKISAASVNVCAAKLPPSCPPLPSASLAPSTPVPWLHHVCSNFSRLGSLSLACFQGCPTLKC